MRSSVPDLSDELLVAAANQGDREAAGTYLARHLQFLSAMSKQLSMDQIDPEDLLSEALVRLVEKWASGNGPSEHVNAYVIRSMRNRVIDELRSPRSKTDAVEDEQLDTLVGADDGMALEQVDLHHEFDLVRGALATLPKEQQAVLIEMTVNGKRPAEVSTLLGRTAPSVSTLFQRSRAALKRAVLVVLLEQGQEECRRNAPKIPAVPADSPDDYPGGTRGMGHVFSCPDCRKQWAVWARMGTLFGFLPLLTVAFVMHRPIAASAATQKNNPSTHPPAPPAQSAAPSAARVAAARLTPASRLIRAGLNLGRAPAAFFLVATLLGTAGIAVVAVPAITAASHATQTRPTAELTVMATPEGSSTALDIHFDVHAPTWTVKSFTITLPADVHVLSAPAGFTCSPSLGGGTCTVPAGTVAGTLSVTRGPTNPAGSRYRIVIIASTTTTTVTGTATGKLP